MLQFLLWRVIREQCDHEGERKRRNNQHRSAAGSKDRRRKKQYVQVRAESSTPQIAFVRRRGSDFVFTSMPSTNDAESGLEVKSKNENTSTTANYRENPLEVVMSESAVQHGFSRQIQRAHTVDLHCGSWSEPKTANRCS